MKRAKAENAIIYWADETGVSNCDIVERSFSPKGRPPVLPVETNRQRVNMISAISSQGSVRFYVKLERDYEITLTQKLVLSIDTQSAEQHALISQFISRCVDLGWSVKALFWKIDTLKYEDSKNSSAKGFLSKIIKAKSKNMLFFSHQIKNCS